MNTPIETAEVTQTSPPAAGAGHIVDLDNTLLRETHCTSRPSACFHAPLLLPGLARSFSAEGRGPSLLRRSRKLDPDVLHTCDEVLAFLRAEAAKGSHLVLCTAADIRVARAIAGHLGLFDEIIATENGVNLKAKPRRCGWQRISPGIHHAGDWRQTYPSGDGRRYRNSSV